jgi:DNA-binding winged helix-turn-helix (wHTH) protein
MNRKALEDDFPVDEETFAFGSFRLIPAQRMLLEDGKPLRLGSRALDILVMLVESAGETIRKDQLIVRTWPDTVVDEGALRVHVAALRKALGDGRAGNRYIANNPGRGYSFVAPVVREQRQPATVPPAAAVGGNLPAPLARIVGRDDIIAALAAQLARRRLATVMSMLRVPASFLTNCSDSSRGRPGRRLSLNSAPVRTRLFAGRARGKRWRHTGSHERA